MKKIIFLSICIVMAENFKIKVPNTEASVLHDVIVILL